MDMRKAPGVGASLCLRPAGGTLYALIEWLVGEGGGEGTGWFAVALPPSWWMRGSRGHHDKGNRVVKLYADHRRPDISSLLPFH